MDKIYRRSTQLGNATKKKKDEKARVRNTILNFRVSPAEKQLIENRIALSGLPKNKFFIESCLYQAILVKGNIRTFSEIKAKMAEIASAVDKNPNLEELDPELRDSLRTILELLNKLFGKEQ